MIPKEIADGIVWETYPKRPLGGQQCGMPRPGYTLSHPDFDFTVSIYEGRSTGKLRDFMVALFELFLDELNARNL